MSAETAIARCLASATRRMRLLHAWRWGARAACIALGAGSAWAIASRVSTVDAPQVAWIAAAAGIAAALGALAGLIRRVSPSDTARVLDARTGSRERIATAAELLETHGGPALAHRQIEDAEAFARTIDLPRALPLRWKREVAALAALSLLLFAMLVAPRLRLFWSPDRKREAALVQQQGKAVEKVARDAEAAAKRQDLAETRRAAPRVRKLASEMQRGGLDKKAAMVRMARLTRDLAARQKQLAARTGAGQKSAEQSASQAEAALKEGAAGREKPGGSGSQKSGAERSPTPSMEQAQQALRQLASAMRRENAEAQEAALRKLADQMGSGKLTPEELRRLQSQLQKIAQAMQGTRMDPKVAKMLQQIAAEMARQMAKMDPATLKKLAEMLRSAGSQCKSGQCAALDAKQLEQLLQALKDGKLTLGGMGQKPGSGMAAMPGGAVPVPLGGKGGLEGGFGSAPNTDTGRRIRVTAKAPNTRIPGKPGSGPNAGPAITYRGAPDQGERAASPLYSVTADQRRAAEGAVGHEAVPAAYRDQVKRYFESVRH